MQDDRGESLVNSLKNLGVHLHLLDIKLNFIGS